MGSRPEFALLFTASEWAAFLAWATGHPELIWCISTGRDGRGVFTLGERGEAPKRWAVGRDGKWFVITAAGPPREVGRAETMAGAMSVLTCLMARGSE